MSEMSLVVAITGLVLPLCCLVAAADAAKGLKGFNCLGNLAAVFGRGGGGEPKLADFELAGRRKPMDEQELYRAFEQIDLKLRKRTDWTDADSNLALVEAMLVDELKLESCKAREQQVAAAAASKSGGRRSSFEPSLLSASVDVELAVNAMLRLLDLRAIPASSSRLACTRKWTQVIEENNRIAKGAIERQMRARARDGGGGVQPVAAPPLERVGRLVYESALARAQLCLPTYMDETRLLLFVTSNKERRLRSYLDRVLANRFAGAGAGEPKQWQRQRASNFETMLHKRPQRALEVVRAMAHALEPDEMGLLFGYFDDENEPIGRRLRTTQTAKLVAERRSVDWFEQYVARPCERFVDALRDIYLSLDFDLKLKHIVVATVRNELQQERLARYESDAVYYRQRAHYLMCEKLANERHRFVELLGAARRTLPARD